MARILSAIAVCFLLALPMAGQGTLAHIAVGGGWQTTLTLMNLSVTAASAQINLYSDTGAPLVVSASGQTGTNSQFTVSIPPKGSASLVFNTSSSTSSGGWINVTSLNGALLRGQGTFGYAAFNWLGVVPLTPSGSNVSCIIPLPPAQTNTITLPFDETSGTVFGLALANISSTSQSISIEFDDQNNVVLATDTLTMASLNHQSFTLDQKYPAVKNQQGVLRITAAYQSVSAVAFTDPNGSLNGNFSTVLPTIQ